MKRIYICKYQNQKTWHEFISMIFTNEKEARKWLENHGRPNCNKWAKDGEYWNAFYIVEHAYSKLPF